MASLVQRIFYTKNQCKILDFIKENHKLIEYSAADKLDKFNESIGTTHTVRINTKNADLYATFTRYKQSYPFRDIEIHYDFCSQTPNGQAPQKPLSETGGFASMVYMNMLNNYIKLHGCPFKHNEGR